MLLLRQNNLLKSVAAMVVEVGEGKRFLHKKWVARKCIGGNSVSRGLDSVVFETEFQFIGLFLSQLSVSADIS